LGWSENHGIHVVEGDQGVIEREQDLPTCGVLRFDFYGLCYRNEHTIHFALVRENFVRGSGTAARVRFEFVACQQPGFAIAEMVVGLVPIIDAVEAVAGRPSKFSIPMLTMDLNYCR
jgi:hypothetical protein